MIRTLTDNKATAFIFSFALLIGYQVILDTVSLASILKTVLLFAEGLLLNYLCSKYKIIGQKNNLVLIVFCLLSVVVIPDLSFNDLVYGLVWLAGFLFAFESSENPSQTDNYLIYFGILLGFSQTVNPISILLFIPVYLLFIQTSTRNIRSLILGFLYFSMVIFAYVCILYVIELEGEILSLIPKLTFEYSAFDDILIKLLFPFVIVSIIVHLLSLNTYKFRFPNKSKILNFTLLIQLSIAIVLIVLTSQSDLLIYALMASAILLSFGFTYKSESIFVNAAFASLLCIALASLYLHKILIL